MSDRRQAAGMHGRNTRSGWPTEEAADLANGRYELGRSVNHVSQSDPYLWVWSARRSRPAVQPRPRFGCSLMFASAANISLGLVAIASGATVVGLVACSALSVATCLLVAAEVASRYGICLLYTSPSPRDA